MIIPSNIVMHDVLAAFQAVPDTATRNYYTCPVAPTSVAGMVHSHFKGIAAFNDKLIFTHTDIDDKATSGKYLIADRLSEGSEGTIDAMYDAPAPQGWCHPCSSQACGSYMALGIQPSDVSGNESLIQICDLQNTLNNEPYVVLGSIAREEGINGVGMTREIGDNGHYIVAAVNGTNLSLYRSINPSLQPVEIDFKPIYSTTTFDESGPGLALVTQADGSIFMFTLNANDNGSNNTMCLYRIDLSAKNPVLRIGQRTMPVPGVSEAVTDLLTYLLNNQTPLLNDIILLLWSIGEPYLNSSFRWGKGLAITSPDKVVVYASDRNVLGMPTRLDFSLLVWE